MKTKYSHSGWISVLFLIPLLVSCKGERIGYTVEEKSIVESVYSSVTIEPESLYSVYSLLPGRIVRINKEIGDSLLFGDVLGTIESVNASNNSANAALNVALIQNQLSGNASIIDDLNSEIATVAYQYSLDSTQLARIQTLRSKNIASQLELDQASLQAKASKTKYDALMNKKKRSQKELTIQRNQAQNNYLSSLSTSNDGTIRSMIDGVVYDIFKKNGELISSQEPFAIIGSKNDFIIRLVVDEIDITKIKLQQEIEITLEAYPDQVFTAEVTRIYPKMDLKTQSFELIGKFKNAPDKLYLGLTGEANIVINKKSKAVVIPREYLIEGQFVETDNGRKKVTIGLESLSELEITSGLSKGTVIYLPEE